MHGGTFKIFKPSLGKCAAYTEGLECCGLSLSACCRAWKVTTFGPLNSHWMSDF